MMYPNRITSTEMTTVFHARSNVRFIEIKPTLGSKEIHRINQDSSFQNKFLRQKYCKNINVILKRERENQLFIEERLICSYINNIGVFEKFSGIKVKKLIQVHEDHVQVQKPI